MDFSTLLENKVLLAAISGLSGVVLTLITQRILGKRGLFTYFVWHNRVGVSADDAVFGTVRVTWNGNVVPNLYSSTVELRNESLADYQNVVVRVFSNDTRLLSRTRGLDGNDPHPGMERGVLPSVGSPARNPADGGTDGSIRAPARIRRADDESWSGRASDVSECA